MAWILGCMRRRHYSPFDEEKSLHRLWARVLRCVAAYFHQKVHFISPRGIVFILYEFGRLDLYPGNVIFRAVSRVRKNISVLNDRGLLALAKLMAKFDWPEKRLLKKLSAEVLEPRRFVRLHPRMLVVLLHAYSELKVRDVQLLEAICGVLTRSECKTLDVRSCATLACSLGRLGVRGSVWKPLAEQVKRRIDRHPPLHLAIIAHAFGKVAAREETLLKDALPEAALDLLPAFSAKHLVCLLDGLCLSGFYNISLFRAALDEYVQRGSAGGYARQQLISRVIFCTILEHPEILADTSPAQRALLERAKPSLQAAPARPYHEELGLCARALSLRGHVRRRKGPYTVDLHVEVPASASAPSGRGHLAVSLMPEADFCPLTRELLGPARLRERHLKKMHWTPLSLCRKQWLALPDSEDRTSALEELLRSYVHMRRRPVQELLALPLEPEAERSAGRLVAEDSEDS